MSIGPWLLFGIIVGVAILGGLAFSIALPRRLGEENGNVIERSSGSIATADIITLLGIVSVAVFYFSRIQGQYALLIMGGVCIAVGTIWRIFSRR